MEPSATPTTGVDRPVEVALISWLTRKFIEGIKLSSITNSQGHIFDNAFRAPDALNLLEQLTKLTREQAKEIIEVLISSEVILARDIGGMTGFFDYHDHIYTIYSSVKNGSRVPQGVLISYAKCYSPTCKPDRRCYSCSCPRFEKPPQLNRTTILFEIIPRAKPFDKQIGGWAKTIDPEILQRVSKAEKSRQEAIYELIIKEQEFYDDLLTWHNLFMKPISRLPTIITMADARNKFVEKVFLSLPRLLEIHKTLLDKLKERYMQQTVIQTIGDIYLEVVDEFIAYYNVVPFEAEALFLIKKERKANADLDKFFTDQLTNEACRRLDESHFVSRPRYRIGRYANQLDAIEEKSKKISPDHPDIELCARGIEKTKSILSEIDRRTSEAMNQFQLTRINSLLQNADRYRQLKLLDPSRRLIHSGVLQQRRGGVQWSPVNVYILDNFIFQATGPEDGPQQITEVYRCDQMDMLDEAMANFLYNSTSVMNIRSSVTLPRQHLASDSFAIVFFHGQMMVWIVKAIDNATKEKWRTMIKETGRDARNSRIIYEIKTLGVINERFLIPYCAREMVDLESKKKKYVAGTEAGIFVGTATENGEPVTFDKVVNVPKVMQLKPFPPDYRCIAILYGPNREVATLSYDILDRLAAGRNETPIPVRGASNAARIEVGTCDQEYILCVADSRANPVSNQATFYYPIARTWSWRDNGDRMATKMRTPSTEHVPRFMTLFVQNTPTPMAFMIGAECVCMKLFDTAKNGARLVLGTTHGYNLIEVSKASTVGLLDDHNSQLREFLAKAHNPRDVVRLQSDYLVCYRERGIFIKSNGQSSRNFCLEWIGLPTSFAVDEPYIIAFSEHFAEVHDLRTGELAQIIFLPIDDNSVASARASALSLRHLSEHDNDNFGPNPNLPIFVSVPHESGFALGILSKKVVS